MSNEIAMPSAQEPVLEGRGLAKQWLRFVSRVTAALSGREPLRLAVYTVQSLPPASQWPRCLVVVSNEAGGEVGAISDGTVWRRTTDRAEVTL